MNYPLFLGNLVMTLLAVSISGSQLALNYAAVSSVDPLHAPTTILYAVWVFIFVESAAVGIEVVKDAWSREHDLWLEEVMPPLFPEGATV
jgi:hypothetical protein